MPDAALPLTCSKRYDGIPLAHRQHRHAGRCAQIHGHSWSIRLTFACRELDGNGFVVDFGGLGFVADWIDTHLDHGIMLSREDPLAERLIAAAPEAFKVFWVPVASCEGLAQAVAETLGPELVRQTGGRAWICRVEVWEDAANSVTLEVPAPSSG